MTDTDIVIRLRLERSDICVEAAREIECLRHCIVQLEAALAAVHGSLSKPEPDPPFTVTDAAPDTPR